MASGLATFRTLTPLQRWSTRSFTCLVRRFGAPTCRLLYAERRVELCEMPWTSRLKASRPSRVRPTAIRVGLGAQALCARETIPCEARTRAIGCTVPCLYTDTKHCSSFLYLPRTVRVSSQSRERETHIHRRAPHTHSARGRAPRGFSGGFCVLLRALHFDTRV